jgi:two-component system sensor histidine kinase AtoS
MRNPLAGIRASAQLLVARHRDHPAIVEGLRDIIEEVDRLNDRISKLVYLARQGHLELVNLPARELLEAARQESRSLLERRDVQLSIDDQTNGAIVRVDPDKMAQTIAELIHNAAHHSSPGSRVTLSSACDDDGATVTYRVTDEGTGIETRVREQVFDLFYSTRPQGTGMGLTCAKRIVEMHGGAISLESEVGVGTRVEVRLPCVRHDRADATG